MFAWLKNLCSTVSVALNPRAKDGATADPSKATTLTWTSVAHKNLGDAKFDEGRFAEAAASYQQAIALDPGYAEAYCNWGNLCRVLNRFDDAERHLRKAADLKPGLANIHYNLATLLLARGKPVEAIARLAQVVARDPAHYAALALLLHLKQKNCDWRDLHAMTGRLRQALSAPAPSPEQIFSPFAFIALPGTTREEQRRCAERWVRVEHPSRAELHPRSGINHQRPRNHKLAIGYLSADFHDHATARLMGEIFELHDRQRFHISAYSYGPDDGSAMRTRLKNAFDRFTEIQTLSDADAARRIHADKIDILVDLKGHTQEARSGILALRPAPCQINYLGYPGTMGAPFIDYLIADPFTVPHEHRPHYSEKVLHLPRCYQPNDRCRARPDPPTRAACGLPDDCLVFCCFNQTYKITPEVFDTWCRLLVAVPKSVLWLYVSTPLAEENLKREAELRGVDRDRLVGARPVNQAEHLARLQCADLFLDTLPCNAHTTCSDALWMGLPVLTCVGDTFPSRVAGSLLLAVDLPELITYNLADYYNTALSLAADPGKLAQIRRKLLADRETAPLFDSKRFTRDLENLYSHLMPAGLPHHPH